MRLVSSVCMLAMLAASCTTPEAPRDAKDGETLQARLDAADCDELRAAMDEALAARDAAAEKDAAAGPSAGQVASVMTMFIPIPGLGLLRRAATAAAKTDEPEPVEPELLYQTARATYAERQCQPALRPATPEPDAQAAGPVSAPDRGAGEAAG